MKVINTLLLFLLFYTEGFPQPLTIQWQKCLGGTLGESGYAIKQTADGGYLSGGIAISNDGDVSGNHLVGHADYWVVKLNRTGTFDWQKCYGGSDEDFLYSIQADSRNGFIMAGIGGSADGDIIGMHAPGDFWIVKCDSIGTIQWQQCLGGSDAESANKIIRCFDSGYLVIGYANSTDYDVIGRHDSTLCPTCSDVWIVKLDSIGTVMWTKCYGGYLTEVGYSSIQTADSGFIFAASTRSDNGDVQGLHGATSGLGGLRDYWIVKVDATGIIQWKKCFGGSKDDIPADIAQTNDGGYIITGNAYSEDYDVIGHHGITDFSDVWIIKLDSLGYLQWQKCLGGSDIDVGKKIISLNDGGYLALCYTISSDGDLISNPPVGFDVWIVRLDMNGNVLWQQCLGGSFGDAAHDIELTPDGGAIFSGLTNSNDGDVSGNHGDFDVWVVKLARLPDGIQAPSNSIRDFSSFFDADKNLHVSLYANGNEHLQLQLFDITGRVILQEPLSITTGFNNRQVHPGQLSSGMYFVRLLSARGVVTKKLVVE